MHSPGHQVENWTPQSRSLDVTYTEDTRAPIDLAQNIGYQFVYEDIVELLPNYRSAKILEVGGGTARNAVYLALRGLDVTCSDFTPEALRLAHANFAAVGARGTLLQDDLMNSRIPGDSFDCVMSFGLL